MTSSAPLRTLRQYLPGRRVERCELCGAELPKQHGHLLDMKTQRLTCACEPCGVLFEHRGAGGYRRVPRRVRRLPDLVITDAEWDTLRIPIGLAFIVNRAAEDRVVALYPGPAGPTESLLSLDAWAGLASRSPALLALEPEVEALLVNRIGVERDCYVAPIDRCYELCGTVRTHWRGFSGGEEVWRGIRAFFASLREEADA